MTVRARFWTLASAAGLAALGLAAAAWWRAGAGAAGGPPGASPAAPGPAASLFETPITLTPEAREAAGLAVEPAGSMVLAESFDAPAVLTLDETRTARIGSMVEGTVVRTWAEAGDRVAAGTLLAELHSHVVHDAWADYRRAIAERRRLEHELIFARDAEARAERLLGDRAISVQERDRAVANRIAAEQQLDMARTEVRRSEEALEHLGVTNKEDPTGETGERIPSRTPIAGVVLERLVTAGTAVTPGTPLFVVSDLAQLWALAEIDEARLGLVAVGRPVAIRVAAYPDTAFAGRIALIGDTVNPKTRRVVVRVVVPNPDGRLKPGMFATAIFETAAPRRVVVVPAAAAQDLGGRAAVFVEERPGVFRARPVTLGPERGGQVEVVAGLEAGERTVTAGAFLLKSHLLGAAAPEEGR